MSHLRSTNPFANLMPDQWGTVFRERLAKRRAEQSLKTLAEQYKQLLDDPRYQAIHAEAKRAVGSALTRLVATALTCGHCAPDAHRIVQLGELVSTPLQVIWDEEQHRATAELDVET